VPDVAFLRYDRLELLAPEDRDQPPLAPDIVTEVRSKGEKPSFRKRKIARYLACETSLVLDADPSSRSLEAHAKDGVRTYRTSDRFEHPAVPWLAFDVAEAFAGLEYLGKIKSDA
jgi:Uma2 family endonuclease